VGRGGAPERLSVRAGCRGVVTTDAYEVNLSERREQSDGQPAGLTFGTAVNASAEAHATGERENRLPT